MNAKTAKSIFLNAVEHCEPEEWPLHLAKACGEDAQLRHKVERLLAAHQVKVDLAEQGREAWKNALPTIDGSPPTTELSGWKDKIFARPETEFVLVLRFEDYADPDTPYMYHCHLLSHEDSGMMGQFVVVAPGEVAQPPAAPGHR